MRHNPASIGLSLDKNGYARIDELLAKLDKGGVNIDKETLRIIVEFDKKGRFSFDVGGSKIRANYGHSFAVDLNLTPLCPPAVLYHGTTERNAESISESGLHKAQRNYVHLTEDISAAIKIGQRRGNPVIFRIDSAKMHRDGFDFYKSGVIWLTDHVPKEYLSLYGIKVGAIP